MSDFPRSATIILLFALFYLDVRDCVQDFLSWQSVLAGLSGFFMGQDQNIRFIIFLNIGYNNIS
jgi:hypothetical protein